jgi:hypothetical protein
MIDTPQHPPPSELMTAGENHGLLVHLASGMMVDGRWSVSANLEFEI